MGGMTDTLRVDAPEFHPRVFMSYSSEPEHNDWVRRLSERLMSNGIDIVLDQWDVQCHLAYVDHAAAVVNLAIVMVGG